MATIAITTPSPPSNSLSPFRFLDLSPELRNKIYGLVLSLNRPIHLTQTHDIYIRYRQSHVWGCPFDEHPQLPNLTRSVADEKEATWCVDPFTNEQRKLGLPLSVLSLRYVCKQINMEMQCMFFAINEFLFYDAKSAHQVLTTMANVEAAKAIEVLGFRFCSANAPKLYPELRKACPNVRVLKVLMKKSPYDKRVILSTKSKSLRYARGVEAFREYITGLASLETLEIVGTDHISEFVNGVEVWTEVDINHPEAVGSWFKENIDMAKKKREIVGREIIERERLEKEKKDKAIKLKRKEQWKKRKARIERERLERAPKAAKIPKKRGRPSNASLALDETEGEPVVAPPQRKRGRQSNATKVVEESEERPEASQPRRKRDKVLQENEDRPESTPPRRKRGGRPSNASRALQEIENEPEVAAPSLKRGRSSNASRAEEEVESRPEQPRKKSRVSTGGESSQPSQAAPRKRAREPQTRQSPRAESPPSPLPFQHLEPVECGVSHNTIDSTWEPLPATAHDRAMQVLADIEKSVVQRLRDERKRTQASTAIQMVTRRLGRKITRGLPFPPGSRPQREEDFDFERILDATRKHEGLLTPALHGVDLLKAEIKREEVMLEREQEALEKLQRNAHAERTRRKAEAKRLHPSLAKREGDVVKWDDRDQLNLAEEQTTGDVLEDAKIDDDLRPLVEELQNHLESMRNNFKQVEGIVPAIEKSEAVIRTALLKQIDEERYDQVIMG
ncbi:hypothetical protein V492_07141 [Pseudogymnoascus sp. VKM F-4246]|nr:hypothetical protein V492_07141 [Pseudogymnoascus sp. VKM F-4246]